MEVRAIAKGVRVQPRKVRVVAAEIRGKGAQTMADTLMYHPSKSARVLRKVLISAIANAVENHGASPDNLRISIVTIDEGMKLKRITQKAMGRAGRIFKRSSHVTIVLEDDLPTSKPEPHGTKAKPRPEFDAKPKSSKKATKAVAEAPAEVVETVEEAPVTAEVAAEPEAVATEEVAAEEAAPEAAEASEEEKNS